VTLFLDEQRIEIEKTGDYIMLVLFSIGMTKGKWGTLLDGLLAFKRAYDQNTPLPDALPKLAAAHPDRYRTTTGTITPTTPRSRWQRTRGGCRTNAKQASATPLILPTRPTSNGSRQQRRSAVPSSRTGHLGARPLRCPPRR
jgi:hypothetical protein